MMGKFYGSISKVNGRKTCYMVRLPDTKRIINCKLVSVRELVGYYSTRSEAEKALEKAYANYKPIITVEDVFKSLIEYRDINGKNKTGTKDLRVYYLKSCNKIYNKNFYDLDDKDMIDILKKYGETESITKKIRFVFSQLYSHAIYLGMDVHNYCNDFYISKNSCMKKKRQQYNTPFSIEEIALLEAEVGIAADIIKITISTNIKLGTLLKLTKDNLDFENNLIRIKSIKQFEGGIPFDEKVSKILKSYCDKTSDYLFKNHLGRRLEYTVFNRFYFQPLLNEYGIVHTTKDLHATYLMRINDTGGIEK